MIFLSLFFIYHLFFFLIGLAIYRGKPSLNYIPAKTKFAVVIPAHNEEKVIGSSVRSILSSNYPKQLIKIFVIADNCTDNTAKIARSAGAAVIERFNNKQRGKQYALNWAFKKIKLSNYDAFCVLDADNHVHPDYFNEIDALYQQGHMVIQGYVDTKNPGDSWVTANYAYMFWYLCRVQLSRKLLGFSAWLAGTGFCISTDILKRLGWNVQTLCDDIEYTAQLLIAGERVTFAPNAIFYDEKPITFKDSIKQRVRWVRGQTQVSIRYIPALTVKVITSWLKGEYMTAVRAFDGIMWIPMNIIFMFSIIYSVINNNFESILVMCISVPFIMIMPMLAESIKNVKVWKYIFTAGFFYYTWIPIAFYSIATCGKKTWWRTPHGV